MTKVRRLSRDDALSLLGEGFHTATRKAGDGPSSTQLWRTIDEMPIDEWEAILNFVLDGMEYSGIHLVRKKSESE
jgi:hypothetical protein